MIKFFKSVLITVLLLFIMSWARSQSAVVLATSKQGQVSTSRNMQQQSNTKSSTTITTQPVLNLLSVPRNLTQSDTPAPTLNTVINVQDDPTTAATSGILGSCYWYLSDNNTILNINAGTIGTVGNTMPGEDPNNSYRNRCGPWIAYRDQITTVKIAPGVQTNSDCSYLFANLTNLQQIDGLTNLDTSQATMMGNLFRSCTSLKKVDLSNFKTANVNNIEGMRSLFFGCASLTDIDLSSFNTSNNHDIGYMFDDCSNLTHINFGNNFDTSQVTSMSYMFYNCTKLLKIDFDKKFDTSKVTNMETMFYNCSSLTNLDLSSFQTSKVTDMGWLFYGCSNLSNITFGTGFDTSNVTLMKSMFNQCSNLTSLDVSKIKTSSATDMSYMFYYCSNLPALDLSNFDTNKVTEMSYMFYGCSNLQTLNLSSFNTANLTGMAKMFTLDLKLWKLQLGPNTKFTNSPDLAMPKVGQTSVYNGYQYENVGSWQSVADGSDIAPVGTIYPDSNSLNSHLATNHILPETLVWQRKLVNTAPTLTPTQTSYTYAQDWNSQQLPPFEFDVTVKDPDSTTVALYYSIDQQLVNLTDIKKCQQLTTFSGTSSNPIDTIYHAQIKAASDLQTLAIPKLGGHHIYLYGVDSGGQFTTVDPRVTTEALAIKENSKITVNTVDQNGRPLPNADETGNRPTVSYYGSVGETLNLAQDTTHYPDDIYTKYHRYHLKTRPTSLTYQSVAKADGSKPSDNPVEVNIIYTEVGSLTLQGIPANLDFGTKVISQSRQLNHLPKSSANQDLQVVDTTQKPNWQLLVRLSGPLIDQNHDLLNNVLKYQKRNNGTLETIGTSDTLVDSKTTTVDTIQTPKIDTTDISKAWWSTNGQQVAGLMLDLRSALLNLHSDQYQGQLTWSITNSLMN